MTGSNPEIGPAPDKAPQGHSAPRPCPLGFRHYACDCEPVKETPMPDPDAVYIAEVIFFDDNPADGRRRVAVCTSLDGALAALRRDEDGADLVATEVSPSALGSATSTTWAVHERSVEPDDEGHLWITREEVSRG